MAKNDSHLYSYTHKGTYSNYERAVCGKLINTLIEPSIKNNSRFLTTCKECLGLIDE